MRRNRAKNQRRQSHCSTNKNLDLAIQQIAKDYGEGASCASAMRRLSISIYSYWEHFIDRALGVGGFPRQSCGGFWPGVLGKNDPDIDRNCAGAKNVVDLRPLLTSSMRWILHTQKSSAWIWMICWFSTEFLARKRCEFARRWCVPTPSM